MDDDFKTVMRAQAEAMPRVRFVCERDWCCGPDVYAVGVLWSKNLDAESGEFVYRKRWLLRLRFKLWLERWT